MRDFRVRDFNASRLVDVFVEAFSRQLFFKCSGILGF